jgi:glycosyltransferase involved in cell wall biosynthesis
MRAKDYVQLFMLKNGIRKIINFAGNENILNLANFKDNKYKDITFCIKTLERKPALERLLFSIARYCPFAQIIIADDSQRFDVRYYKDLWARLEMGGLLTRPVAYNLGYDMGLSYGRNFLVDKATTKYCLILDDDYEFTEKTDILKFQTILDNEEEIGIAGGLIMTEGVNELHFEHNFELVDRVLYHRVDESELKKIGDVKYITPESIPNFFLMRKELGVKWDDKIKIGGEHTQFMFSLKGKWKVAYCRDVSIDHIHLRDQEYKAMRKREEFLIYMMKNNGFDKIVYLNGGGYEVKNGELIKF